MASTEFPHDKKQAAAQVAKLKKANAAKKKGAPKAVKKKAPTTVVGQINDQGIVGKMLTPRTTLMRALLGKKKPATKKKPIKKKAK